VEVSRPEERKMKTRMAIFRDDNGERPEEQGRVTLWGKKSNSLVIIEKGANPKG